MAGRFLGGDDLSQDPTRRIQIRPHVEEHLAPARERFFADTDPLGDLRDRPPAERMNSSCFGHIRTLLELVRRPKKMQSRGQSTVSPAERSEERRVGKE